MFQAIQYGNVLITFFFSVSGPELLRSLPNFRPLCLSCILASGDLGGAEANTFYRALEGSSRIPRSQ